ncbi:tRNA (N6-threonylcarbamoyladenosine(37)-N6)-methyltransferase TrmO [Aureimonas sp. ME7]|uniref:tRNA (N6-threonylcarbamoyladenosine(37)-N6)-methyltransferase TrmO n=1 Tax=Aureimonas sp. ME7 TaxID=2744252 RepID=UPI0015F6B202|nr:tRNA (N6-threonylcarbamoyladenosine(37)-N6)-methyltransferase TrmO [Aureimonas sp. ME7]
MSAETWIRDGELRFELDVSLDPGQTVHPIGLVRSPWEERGQCPKNLRDARERDGWAHLEIEEAFRPALTSLQSGQWIHVLTWLDRGRRDLALQMPRHASEPLGTFSLRSPVRPNPIGLHLVRIMELDMAKGVVRLDAIDVLDRTPLLDIKPYLPSVDRPPED